MTESSRRGVMVQRLAAGEFAVVTERGAQVVTASRGTPTLLTPIELLLGAIGACTAMDVDALTARRAEPDEFVVAVDANKIRDEQGNHLTDIAVTFRVRFPATESGAAAAAILPELVRRSHDRLCTVSRTVEIGSPITTTLAPTPVS
jgi:putative redox protein